MCTPLSSLLSVFLGLVLIQCHSEPSTTPISTVENQTSVVKSSNKEPSAGSWQDERVNKGKEAQQESKMLVPDPSTPYQDVKPMAVESHIDTYTAILPIQTTPSGTLSLQVKLNPQKHSIEKLTLLYARQNQRHAINQIGNGVGHYNAENQRYYVNVAYQEVLDLSDKLKYSGDLQEVDCWVSIQTNTAAIKHVKYLEQ